MNDELYAVSDHERDRYNEFSKAVWKQLFQPPPYTLWYYTSASTLARILQSKEVWSTQISCLNEHTEFRHSVRLLRDEFKAFVNHEDESVRYLAAHLLEAMEQDGADSSFFFVMCMSSVRDDLSQWRAYGSGEGGVAIGFNPMGLVTDEIRRIGYLVPVRYREGDQKALVAHVAAATMSFFREGLTLRPGADWRMWTDSFLATWRDNVIYFAPVLKHGSFESEHEWRLIVGLSPNHVSKVEIQQRSALISRHLPLKFGDKLPIREVVVGPCRHPRCRASAWAHTSKVRDTK
jgi:hypothetical protein